MATYNWTGASSNNWNVAGNWVNQATGVAAVAAPTAADDCRFGVGTGATNTNCTINTGSLCRSWTVNGYTGTITHTAGITLSIGDATAGASNYAINFATSGWTYTLGSATTSAITLVSTSATQQTIVSGSKTFGNFTVNGAGSSYLFGSTFASSGVFTLTAGALDTGSQTCQSSTFINTSSSTRSLTMGTTNWTITSTAAATVINFNNVGTLTYSAASSTWTIGTATSNTRTLILSTATHGAITYTVAGSTGTLALTGIATIRDIIFSDASNARTCSLGSSITLSSANPLASFRGTSGKLMSLVSSASGTARTITRSGPGLIDTDYLSIQDIISATPYTFYAGANSTNVSGNTNIVFTVPPTAPYVRQTKFNSGTSVTSLALTFNSSTTAGQLLVALLQFTATPGTITLSGWTAAVTRTNTAAVAIYYKIADGTETTITPSWVNAVTTHSSVYEVAGFTGTPTLDVTDSNASSGAATTLSTGSGATNTASPAYALAMVGGSSSMAASTAAPTNSYQEDYNTNQTSAGVMKSATLPLTTTASQTTTFTWGTSRTAAAALAVFKGVTATSTGSFFPFF